MECPVIGYVFCWVSLAISSQMAASGAASSLFREMGVLNSNSKVTLLDMSYLLIGSNFSSKSRVHNYLTHFWQSCKQRHDHMIFFKIGMSQAFFHFWFDETLLFIDFHEMNDNPKDAKKSSNDMQLNASLVFSKGIKSAGEHEEREGKNGF